MSLQFNGFTGTLDYVGTGGGGGSITGGGASPQVAFWTGNTAIGGDVGFLYDSGGHRVGVGEPPANLAVIWPGAKLHATQAGTAPGELMLADMYSGAGASGAPFSGPQIVGRKARGTSGAELVVIRDDVLLTLGGRGWQGANFANGSRAVINMFAAETWSGGAQGTYMAFSTTGLGTLVATERMRIESDGSVLIGTPSLVAGSRTVITGGALHVLGGNALRLQGAGAGFSSFVDPTHAANILYTLPPTQGPAGTMLTNVDGAGTLDWKTPPAGLPGEDGIDGDPGPPGVTGATGPQGATGNTGPQGATGMAGLHGFDGIDGDDGMAFPIPGVQGSQGVQGIQGIQGVQGLQGFMGIPGGDGLDGEEGMPMPGIPGPQGIPGSQGVQGVQGPPGLSDDGGGGTDEWPSYFGQPTLTGDPFNMYTRLAGRIGTTNDTLLSTSGVGGTFSGSNQQAGFLTLQGSTVTAPSAGNGCGTVRVNSNLTLLRGVLNTFMTMDPEFTMASASIKALVVGVHTDATPCTWKLSSGAAGTHQLFLLAPNFTQDVTGTTRNAGAIGMLVNNVVITADGGVVSASFAAFQHSYGANGGTGRVTITDDVAMSCQPALDGNATVLQRVGLRWLDQVAPGVGKQPIDIAVDVADQTSTVTPATPTVTPQGTPGVTTYGYKITVVALGGGESLVGAEGTTSTGNATLSGTNFNRLTWTAAPFPVAGYNVYRTSGPLAAGKINVSLVATTTFDDTGLTAGVSPPVTDGGAFTIAAAVRSAIADAGNAGKMFLQDTGGARSEFAGKFTRYNNDVTAGNGMASVLGAASSLARATSLGATTVVTVTSAGTYRAAIYVFTSVVGTGTGSVTGTLTWTDDSNTAKSAVTSNSASLANATSFASEEVYFRAKAASAVQYAATLTGTAGTSTFDVYAAVERIA